MKWFTKIRYAMDMLAENPKNFIASVLLCGVGLSLIGFNMLVYLAGNHSYKSAEDVLSQGIEHTGILEVDDYYLESGTNFRREAYQSEIIQSIGGFKFNEFPGDTFSMLKEIQNNKAYHSSERMPAQFLQMLVVDKELFPLCNLEYETYISPDELENSDETMRYIYLGYAYREIPLGTEFIDSSVKPALTYRVAGILKKDTSFASTELMSGVDFTTLRSDINMNYEILCVNPADSKSWPWMFSVNENYTMKEGMEELYRIAEIEGVEIEAYTLQSSFDELKIETKIMQENLLEMLILILIVIAIVVTILQIVQIFNQARSYGIMYSLGFMTSEILAIMVIRNVIYFVFSLCIGIGGLIFIGNKFFISNIQNQTMFFQLLFQQVLPISVTLMLILFCIITIIPCFLFSRQDPIKLIQGE